MAEKALFEQVMPGSVKQVFGTAYNTNYGFFENMVRMNGEPENSRIRSLDIVEAAIDNEANVSNFYLRFHQQVEIPSLTRFLSKNGAKCITLGKFSTGGAAKKDMQRSRDYVNNEAPTSGDQSRYMYHDVHKLEAGAWGLAKHMSQSLTLVECPACGNRFEDKMVTEPEEEEWDVVKKQKAVQVSNEDADVGESATALSNFLEFNDAVAQVIFEIDAREKERVKEEREWACLNPLIIIIGFMYIAWNISWPDLVKIGATRRDSPFLRIKQLSGTSVPVSFQLVAAIITPDPFGLERRAKKQFKAQRILKDGDGRKTEFFRITKETAEAFLAELCRETGASLFKSG